MLVVVGLAEMLRMRMLMNISRRAMGLLRVLPVQVVVGVAMRMNMTVGLAVV